MAECVSFHCELVPPGATLLLNVSNFVLCVSINGFWHCNGGKKIRRRLIASFEPKCRPVTADSFKTDRRENCDSRHLSNYSFFSFLDKHAKLYYLIFVF